MPSSKKVEELFEAISDNDGGVVWEILVEEQSVHPDVLYTPEGCDCAYTPLLYAAEMGALSCIDPILEPQAGQRADINKAHNGGWTALMLAVHNNHHRFVRRLLDYKPDVEKRNPSYNNMTAEDIAKEYSYKDCIQALMEYYLNK